MLLLICANGNAQNAFYLSAAVGSSSSWVGMNKQSKYYNSKWETPKNTFSPEAGYGFELGIHKKVSTNFTLSCTPRWLYWGGHTKTEDRDTHYYIALALYYQSFRIPVTVDYRFYHVKKWAFSSTAGLGIDYTYDLIFYQSTRYGTGDPQKRNVGITSPFMVLGLNMTYQKNEEAKLAYQFAFNFETDHWLNPGRFNDFGGYFGQEKIPLNSYMTNAMFKIRYKL